MTAPDKAATDYFGKRVSQSGDILAVGAYKSDPDGIIDAGAAYLYRLESNGTATYLTRVTAPDKSTTDLFGISVSQSEDILAVGAYVSDPEGVSDAGAVYLYRLESNSTATYLTKVTAPDKAPADRFGISVSQSGGVLAVGAHYSDPDGLSNAGATYLYHLESNNTASYLTKITAPDKAAIDYFGRTVSQSGDILVVGAHYSDPDGFTDAGAVYTFDISDYVQEGSIVPVVSLRSWVPEYDALYADITVDEEITLIVRVLGPSLGTEDAASGTTFTIYDENYDELTSNSGWESSANASQLQELNLSPAHSSEAATLITLTPGVYSIEAEVSGYAEKILQLEFFSTDGQVFDKLSALESWNMYKAEQIFTSLNLMLLILPQVTFSMPPMKPRFRLWFIRSRLFSFWRRFQLGQPLRTSRYMENRASMQMPLPFPFLKGIITIPSLLWMEMAPQGRHYIRTRERFNPRGTTPHNR